MDYWTGQTMTQKQRIQEIYEGFKQRSQEYTQDQHLQDVMIYVQVCAMEEGGRFIREVYDGKFDTEEL